MRIRKYTVIVCLAISVAMTGSVVALAADDATIKSLIETSNVSAEIKTQIEQADRWLFADGQNRLAVAAQDRVAIGDIGFTEENKLFGGNAMLMRSILFKFRSFPAADPADADILIIPSESLDAAKRSYPGAFARLHVEGALADEPITDLGVPNCKVIRIVSNYRIQKTIIMTPDILAATSSDTASQNAVSCMNKGIYYHFGYGGVGSLDNNIFASKSKRGGYVIDFARFLFPSPLYTTADMAGMKRVDVIQQLLVRIKEALLKRRQ